MATSHTHPFTPGQPLAPCITCGEPVTSTKSCPPESATCQHAGFSGSTPCARPATYKITWVETDPRRTMTYKGTKVLCNTHCNYMESSLDRDHLVIERNRCRIDGTPVSVHQVTDASPQAV